MILKNRETAAAWAVAVGLVVLIASAPWDKLQSRVPPGVVDMATPRFSLETGSFSEAPRDQELRFSPYSPDGL